MSEFANSRGSRRVIYKLSRGNERETVVNPKTGTGRERKQQQQKETITNAMKNKSEKLTASTAAKQNDIEDKMHKNLFSSSSHSGFFALE